jgi:glycosyltransferase involved in cell wall biosynthesis
MKIPIVTDAWHPQISGVVTTLTRTIQELQNLGHQILSIHPNLFELTIPCPTYPRIRLVLNPVKKLSRLLDRFEPDCIHVVTEGPLGLAGRFYCTQKKYPFTTSFTTRFDEYIELRFPIPRQMTFALLRWFHSAASRVMLSSAALKEELESREFSRVALWPRGVDTELFCPRDKDFLPDPKPILIYVGRIAVEKSIEDFLQLNIPGTKVVVGDGPALLKLKNEYPQVRFVGAKVGEELACYYAAADVFVFPSRTDTFGIVMLEALACGVPVAAYPVRGPIDIINQGVTGYLDENLGKAVLQALALDPEKCREFAMQFSWRRSAERFVGNLVKIESRH